MVALGNEDAMLRAIPRSVYAMTHLWTMADNGRITPREAYRATKLCARILRNEGMTRRFKFGIDLGNMSQKDFCNIFADMPLTDLELGAIFHALTR